MARRATASDAFFAVIVLPTVLLAIDHVVGGSAGIIGGSFGRVMVAPKIRKRPYFKRGRIITAQQMDDHLIF